LAGAWSSENRRLRARAPKPPIGRRAQGVESCFVTVGGLRMHARVAEGPAGARPVVLVHGQVVSSRFMVPLAVALSRWYTVYVPDLPGFGNSGSPPRHLDVRGLADWLAAWLRVCALGPVPLVGNSLGCQVIVDLAARCPELVSHAVLQGPTIDPRGRSAPRQVLGWLRDMPLEAPSLGLAMAADYFQAGPLRATATFRAALADRLEDKLPLVTAPTLVIRGDRDQIISEAWARAVARLLPRGELAHLPGGAHTANYTLPHEVAQLVHAFLRDAPSSST
jgi:pimeloyl-ACP methyl ester carboxylesterase